MNVCNMESNSEIIDILGTRYHFKNCTISYDKDFTVIYDARGVKIAVFTNKNIIVTLKGGENNE